MSSWLPFHVIICRSLIETKCYYNYTLGDLGYYGPTAEPNRQAPPRLLDRLQNNFLNRRTLVEAFRDRVSYSTRFMLLSRNSSPNSLVSIRNLKATRERPAESWNDTRVLNSQKSGRRIDKYQSSWFAKKNTSFRIRFLLIDKCFRTAMTPLSVSFLKILW